MKTKNLADEILSGLASIAEQPYEKAKEWKNSTGGKVLGVFPMHFPEELIHAAGLLPVLFQEIDEPVTMGHAYYPPFFCGLTRSVIDQGAKGYLDFMDAFLGGGYCIQVVGANEALRVIAPKKPNLFFMIPVGRFSWSQDDMIEKLRELKEDIEEMTGKEIAPEAIRNSIKIYNKNRMLIQQVYDLKFKNPDILNAKEMVNIIKTSMVMLKEDHNAILEELLPALKERKVEKADGVRVFISGALCGTQKYDILTMIEQSGALVVADDLFQGYRYVSTNMDESKDPLEAIADHYMAKNDDVPCPTRCDTTSDWPGWLVSSVEKIKADALIILIAKFCEPHLFFYPDIKEAVEEAGIPHLLVDIEHEVVSLEAIRTRVEAFIEMIQEKKYTGKIN